MRRAEVGENFQKARQPADVELVSSARILFGGQESRVQAVPRLVGDPVGIPLFLPVFALERGQTLVAKILDKEPDGWVFKILRRPGIRRRGFER